MQQTTETLIKAGIDLTRVRAVLGPVLAAHGVDLVDLEWTTQRTGWTLRLTIERGLPVQPAEPASTEGLGMMPADSSSGRTLERRRQ